MSLLQQPWEVRLLTAAQEALDSQSMQGRVETNSRDLREAYRVCEVMTRRHSKTFYLASALLPRDKRLAARALYAFCRITDDIVDDPAKDSEQGVSELREWQQLVMTECPVQDQPVCLAWADAQMRFDIPRGYAQQLIDGVARDARQQRYQTFDELAEYSYGVASTVGLMAMHIVGFQGADALPYAVRLGVALQLTNILRDVGEDWRNGRLYLPLEELAQFGLDEADVERGLVDDRWRAFMRFQIARNRQLYAESLPGVAMLHRNGRFAIAAAANLYQAILVDIEASDYDVFSRRAHLRMWGKLRRMPQIWFASRKAAVG
jgi:15-cis-phytoene synthase